MGKPTVRVIASDKNWIEGEAIRQLKHTATLEGMRLAVGLPDLHPGKGNPIGAAFFTQGTIYPYLVGNDIGCGMGLWSTDLKTRKIKRDRWVKRLTGLDAPWKGDTKAWLQERDLPSTDFDKSLGTVGGGNHFAELQAVDKVFDAPTFEALGLNKNKLVVLVHSGSRGLGHSILREHIEKHKDGGLDIESEEASTYIERHNQAVAWARANRALIAHRLSKALNADIEPVLDLCHNSVLPSTIGEEEGWLHRKGAAPADRGAVVIPGSRGTMSYLVMPTEKQDTAARSLAHGAGRKWARGDVRRRLSHLRKNDLVQTDLGGSVICENKQLLFEEAPQAYKNIDVVIEDLAEAGLITLIARLRPVITYKTG